MRTYICVLFVFNNSDGKNKTDTNQMNLNTNYNIFFY